MIFNTVLGTGLNCSVRNYSNFAELPSIVYRNAIGIITETPIPKYGFGELNPFVLYQNKNLLSEAVWTSGYISDKGVATAANTTNKEEYSSFIPIKYGNTYRYNYILSASSSMWMAISEYALDEATGEYTFNVRTVPVNQVTGTVQRGYFTPTKTNTVAINISIRTFGKLETIEFIDDQYQSTLADVKNGTLWIGITNTAPNGFNLLTNNVLQIYPIRAEQYVNDIWEVKEAYIYLDEWKKMEFALYQNGLINEKYTGGWITLGKQYAASNGTALDPVISYTDNKMSITYSTTGKSGIVYCANKIDLSVYNTLYFKGQLKNNSTSPYTRLCIWSDLGTYWSANVVSSATNNIEDSVELDITFLQGEYYIGFGLFGTGEILMEELILR